MKPHPTKTNQADLLASVLDSSLDGIIAFSSVRNQANEIVDFTIDFVNKPCERIVGKTAEQMLHRRLLELFPGNVQDGLFDAYIQVAETGRPFCTEHHYAHDGLNNWFSIRAAKCGDGFTVTFSDITRRKADADQLEKLSLVASRTNNGVMIADARGRIQWVNYAFVKMTGYSLQEVKGKTPGSLLQGALTDPGATERIRKSLKAGQGFRETLVNYNKAGQSYWIDIEVQPIRNDQGEITNFMAIEADVTDRINQQRELEAQRHRLEFALRASRTGLWD